MAERHQWEPGGWEVVVTETSSGVYEITAISASLGTISVTTDNAEEALGEVRQEAEERSRTTGAI